MTAFVAGLMVAYGSFGVFAALIGQAVFFSRAVYLGVGAAMFIGGTMTLLRQYNPHACAGAVVLPRKKSVGAVFLLGASFAFVISPCCTPVVIVILAYGAQLHSAWYGAMLLAVFALGHALPLIILGSCTAGIARMLTRWKLEEASHVVAGAMLFALSGYYLCLA